MDPIGTIVVAFNIVVVIVPVLNGHVEHATNIVQLFRLEFGRYSALTRDGGREKDKGGDHFFGRDGPGQKTISNQKCVLKSIDSPYLIN